MNLVCWLFSLFAKITGSKTLNDLLGYGAGFLKSLLLLTTEVKFIGVVIHATSIRVHLFGTLLVKFFQQAEDAARDLAALLEALIGVGVLLLAVEEGHVLGAAPDRDVLGRRHQHRRRRDRLPRGVHGCAARRHRCGRGRVPGAPGLGDLGVEVGEARRADPDEKGEGEGDGERKAEW
jgi:hypothetical protein